MKFSLPQMGVGGQYRVTFWDVKTGRREPVVLEDGSEFWGGDWHPNLITDVGLDLFATTVWYGPNNPGTGTDPFRRRLTLSGSLPEVKEASGAIEASQSGTTVTATASFFTPDDVGRAIVWADSSNARIVSFTSGTSVEVDKTQSVSQQSFERWHVELQTLPGVVATADTTPPDRWDREWLVEGDFAVVRYRYSVICELDDAANVNGIGLGPNDGPNVVIVENIRDASGNAITVPMLAGKAVRVDSILEVRVSRLPWVVDYQIDEYDAGNQLVGTRLIEADAWMNLGSTSGGSSIGAFPGAAGSAIRVATPSYNNLSGFLLNGPPLVPGEISGDIRSYGENTSGTAVVAPYVAGTRKRVREFIIDAASQNRVATAMAISWSTVVNSSLGLGGAQLMVQFRDNETFEKENTHTLRIGVESSWDRDYTVS